MLKVEINQVSVTKDEVVFGLVIRYGENGPVRFAQAKLSDEVLSPAVLSLVAGWAVRQTNRLLDCEPDDSQLVLPLEV
jgi:hypothetical protein